MSNRKKGDVLLAFIPTQIVMIYEYEQKFITRSAAFARNLLIREAVVKNCLPGAYLVRLVLLSLIGVFFSKKN